ATDARSVTLDTTAPSLTVTAPAQGSRVATNSVQVTGTTDADATVSVNGISAPVSSIGGFDVTIVLLDGHHTVTIVATDPAGNHGLSFGDVSVAGGGDQPGRHIAERQLGPRARDRPRRAHRPRVRPLREPEPQDRATEAAEAAGAAGRGAVGGAGGSPLSLYSCRGERVDGMPQKSASSTTRAGPPTVQGIVSIPRSAIALRTCSARSGNVFT